MLNNQTIEKLYTMKMLGMIDTLKIQEETPEMKSLPFQDRFGMLVDAEFTARENSGLEKRLKQAGLKLSACFEDIDLHVNRGLDRTTISQLALCKWVTEGINILLDGPTGIGKSYVSTALAHKACRQGFTAKYYRVPRLFQDFAVSRLKNRYSQLLNRLAKIDVIILDDFGLAPMTDEQSRDLLEVIDDRVGKRPVIIASQLPLEDWYEAIPRATIADAILDRIIHSAHKLKMRGKSCRPGLAKKQDKCADSTIDNKEKEK